MSVISSVPAAPPQSAPALRRPAEAQEAPDRDTQKRTAPKAAPGDLPNKTKVRTEQIGKYEYGYTFIDTDTAQIVGRYPAEPFVTSPSSVGGTIA